MGNLWKSTLDVESARQVRYDEFYDPYDEWMDEEAMIDDAIARAEEEALREQEMIDEAIARAEEADYDFIEPDFEDYCDEPEYY